MATVIAQEYDYKLRTRRLGEISRKGWPRGVQQPVPTVNDDDVTHPYVAVNGAVPTPEELDDDIERGPQL